MYLKDIKIIKVLPCIAEQSKIRFHAEFEKDISELMPYLNRILEGAIYNHKGKTLTLKKGGLITLHPKSIAAGQVKDIEKAKEICEWLKEKINYVYENKDKIEPLFERRQQLTALEVYKLLPQKNCKKCGELTCIAFAVKVLSEEKSIMLCSELFLSDYSEKRKELFEVLKNCGYSVPKEFV